MAKNSKKESKLQTTVSTYLKQRYPSAEFMCDMAAGMKLSVGMANLAARWRSNSGLPDIVIFERRGDWAMLAIELKAETADLWKADGSLRKGSKNKKTGVDHLENQQAMHIKLRTKGYYACFGKGFDHCRGIIDWYMNGAEGNPPAYVKKQVHKLF